MFKESVEDFKNAMGVMTDLGNEALAERHWRRIFDKLEQPYFPGQAFKMEANPNPNPNPNLNPNPNPNPNPGPSPNLDPDPDPHPKPTIYQARPMYLAPPRTLGLTSPTRTSRRSGTATLTRRAPSPGGVPRVVGDRVCPSATPG